MQENVQEQVNENPLGTESISKLMVKFAVPSIIGMLVGALYNIVDQYFIGQAVGPLGNAATNIAFPLSTSCLALALLFGIGGASCFNLAMGRGDKEHAPYYVGNAMFMLVFSGIVLFAISEIFLTPLLIAFGSPSDVLPFAQDYVKVTAIGFPFLLLTTGGGHLVRADGSPRMTMICNLTGAIINTILDAVFVLGFNWGMKGAAWATVIGQFCSAILVVVYLLNFKTVKLQWKHFVIRFRYIMEVAAIGMGSFFNQLAMMVVQVVLNNLLKHYGALSVYGASIPLACAGIVMKVNQLFFSILIGIAQGTQPIESYNYGAGNYKRVKGAYFLALKAGACISVTAFLLFQFFPREILGLFGDGSPEYFELGVKFFKVFIFLTCLNFLQPITSTFFTSIGKSIKGVFLSLTRQILFLLPLVVILPRFFGIDGILYAGPVADILSAGVAIGMAAYEMKLMTGLEEKKHEYEG